MNEHDELIKKCELLLYSITDKEVVIPLKDHNLYMDIKNYKEECIEKLLELLNRDKGLKIIWDNTGTMTCCRKCNALLFHTSTYCMRCGYKIDWSDEE